MRIYIINICNTYINIYIYIVLICKNQQLASFHAAIKYIKQNAFKYMSSIYNIKYCVHQSSPSWF